MKIVIFDTYASTASIGKITFSLYKKLKSDGHEAIILHGYDDGCTEDCICITNKYERTYHYIMSKLTGLHGYYSNFATKKAINILKDFQPDIVQLYNLHGWYLNINILLKYLSDNNIKTVYSMLDEYPYLGRCCYSFECNEYANECLKCSIDKNIYPATLLFRRSKKIYAEKKKAYGNFKNICFVGPKWVLERASLSPAVNNYPMYEVDEFVDVNNIFYPRKQYKYIDQELIMDKRIIILTVTVYSNPRKGGKYFVELAKRFENNPNYLFVFVGMDKEDVELPSNCIPYGFVNNQQELAEYYSCADMFVCTSCADTMPNSCLEALSCGTPVLGFDITGIPYVADSPLGQFVKPASVDELYNVVSATKKKSKELVESCRQYGLNRYSPEKYYEKMLNIYHDVLERD